MTRYAARVDANQPDIVDAFRKLGISVKHLHRVGEGCPDIACGYGGYTRFCEIKTAKGKLTKAQKEWAADWTGGIYLIRNVGDVIACAASMKRHVEILRNGMTQLPIRDDPGNTLGDYERGYMT